MINNRRSELQILSDILNIAKNRANKTKILYQANLSYNQLQKYLVFLMDKGLLEQGSRGSVLASVVEGKNYGRIYYKTTEKGLKFLDSSQKIYIFLNESSAL